MKTFLPSLVSLRAFEATARLLSVKNAAEELGVTPGAVSLQIKELEACLAVALFERKSKKMILTPKGKRYYNNLRTAFRIIHEATDEIIASSKNNILTIGCTSSFAIQWLIPRTPYFEASHTDIDLRISASNRIQEFGPNGIDVSIRHGLGNYDGLISEKLIDDELVPVCSPNLVQRNGEILDPSDLQRYTLLHDEHKHDWALWFRAAGAPELTYENGTVFVDSNGSIEAAKAGLGIALVRLSLVEKEINEGTLRTILPYKAVSDLAYYLVYPPGALAQHNIAIFRNWIIEAVKISKSKPD